MRKRWLKLAILILLIPLLLPLAFLLCERVRGQISLAHYRHVLRAAGEKLTAQELASLQREGENGAPEVLEGKKELKEGVLLPTHYPPRMKLTLAGRAVICFQEAEWVEDKVTYRWEQVAADLEANEATLGRIRAALAKPVMDNKLDYAKGPKLLIPHLAQAKALTFWFGAECQLALHEGRTGEALSALRGQIQLPRLMGEDRLLISELVRIAIAAIARMDTWEALQAEGWSDEALARVQEDWANSSFAAGMVRGLEGEMVYGECTFDLLRKSNEETIGLFYAMEEFLPTADSERALWERTVRDVPGGEAVAEFIKKQVYCRVWRFAWLDQAERRYLELTRRLMALARAGTTNRSLADIEPAMNRLDKDLKCKSLYDRLRYPALLSPFALSSAVNKAMRAETERSLVLCAVALKRYTLRHGSAPASLAALVPEFIAAVPIDYMDGKPIRYHLNADGSFVFYSVGADGKDGGGDTALVPGKTNRHNLWERRDWVWPAPALPDEVAAYRKEP
jgi:hypothetical protein